MNVYYCTLCALLLFVQLQFLQFSYLPRENGFKSSRLAKCDAFTSLFTWRCSLVRIVPLKYTKEEFKKTPGCPECCVCMYVCMYVRRWDTDGFKIQYSLWYLHIIMNLQRDVLSGMCVSKPTVVITQPNVSSSIVKLPALRKYIFDVCCTVYIVQVLRSVYLTP